MRDVGGPVERGPVILDASEASADLALQVNRDNVLRAAAVLLHHAERLDDVVNDARHRGGRVGLCGGDPVSVDAARAFNRRLDALYATCLAYNQQLRDGVYTMAAIVRSYGIAEDEISAVMRGRG